MPQYKFEEIKVLYGKEDEIVAELARRSDKIIVVNVCDAIPGTEGAGVEVVKALEKYNIPYTGASVADWDMTKE
jgi:translation initiation factor 2B subunit (eIF-2B alpha/beta/delta family)